MKTIRLLALLLLACLAQPAFAADYWACACGTGADSGCVAGTGDGSSAANAASAFPTQSAINSAAAGTTFRFCKGGLWSGLGTIQLNNTNATASSRITFDDYTAAWGGTSRPRFQVSAGGTMFYFGVFNGAASAGYNIKNVFIDGVNCAAQADHAFNYNSTGVADVLIENVEVAYFKLFMELPAAISGRSTERIIVRNSTIRNSTDIGFLGEATDILFEGNTFSRNGGVNNPTPCSQGDSFGHHMYFSGDTGKRAVIRNNFYEKAGNGGTGGSTCTSGGITFHGVWDQVVIEHNIIDNSSGEGAGCGGIDVNAGYSYAESFSNVTIRGNTLVNAAISTSNAQNVVVENNRIIKLSNYYGCCGVVVPRDDGSTGDAAMGGFLRVRNNSVSFPSNATSGTCFEFNAFSGHATGAEVANNLCKIETGGTGVKCFGYMALSNYTVADYNAGYGCSPWATGGATTYTALSNAQAASFDLHSINTDPLWLTTPTSTNTTWGLQIQSGSPAKNAGSNTYCARLDAIGYVRTAADATCDIGAREQGNGN